MAAEITLEALLEDPDQVARAVAEGKTFTLTCDGQAICDLTAPDDECPSVAPDAPASVEEPLWDYAELRRKLDAVMDPAPRVWH